MKIAYFKVLLAVSLLIVFKTYGNSNKNFKANKSSASIIYSFPSSLSNFEYEVNLGPSTNQTFSINDGSSLNRPYTVTAPAGFEVSISSSSGFNTTITIPGETIDSGNVVVYIRLASGLSINTYSGNLSISAPDATVESVYYPPVNEQISLSGEVSRKTTSWNGTAWSNDAPNSSDIAIISSGYSTLLDGNFSAWSLDIAPGVQLTIDDNTFVEIETNVVVNGTLSVTSSGAFVQNDDSASFTVNTGGEAYVSKTTSALNKWYDYTYWSSPVSNATVEDVFSFSNPNYRYWFNAENFLDVYEEIDNTNSFVAGHDDIDDDGDDWTLLNNADVLAPGVGYATTHSSAGFISGNSYSYIFSGPFNTGTISTPIHYNGDNGDKDWNFIGNPYPSAISVDAFFAENASVIGDAIYLWSHATPPNTTGSGNETLNFSADDYAIVNAGSGEIAGGSSVIPNRYIPSGQGFFVQGMANGNVVFNNAMRMKDDTSNNQFFRQSSSSIADKLWLNLTSDNGVFNQILVAYVDGATDGNDGSAYDAPRFLSSGSAAMIYSTIANETDTKYAIQGKAISSLNTQESIAIGFYTSITEATVYTFSIAKKQGDFMSNNPVFIKDNLLGITHNLIESDYAFTSNTGNFMDRFEVVFSAETLGTNDESLQDGIVIKELNKDSIEFSSNSAEKIETVHLYNIEGKRIYDKKINNVNGVINVSHLSVGAYVAQVAFENGAMISEKIIKRE